MMQFGASLLACKLASLASSPASQLASELASQLLASFAGLLQGLLVCRWLPEVAQEVALFARALVVSCLYCVSYICPISDPVKYFHQDINFNIIVNSKF